MSKAADRVMLTRLERALEKVAALYEASGSDGYLPVIERLELEIEARAAKSIMQRIAAKQRIQDIIDSSFDADDLVAAA